MTHQNSDAFVFFGATGDLAYKKIFPALQAMIQHGELEMPIIGIARAGWSLDKLRKRARESVQEHGGVDKAAFATLSAQLRYVDGDYNEPATYGRVCQALNGARRPVHYLAIPPSMFGTVVQGLARAGCARNARVIVEKPFGRDLVSARALNRTLHEVFPESSVFRIDHYLGKEAVEDLLVFRFSNMLLEPAWNRNYVRSVQITMAESIGVEGRGSFYDSVGAVRDVFQNHLLQVASLLAMEPPVGADSSYLQDEKAKVLAAMVPIDPAEMVRGQYEGYLDEKGVTAGSTTETFVAATLYINSWRWAGVPWHLRVGKALAANVTEAVVELREPPQLLFDEAGGPEPGRNLIRFRLGKDDGVTFGLQAKTPGPHLDSQEVDLRVDFAAALGERQDAYERLLDDALDGSARRFAREDVVDHTWRIVQPALDDPGPVHPYPRGSWGPGQADRVCGGDPWFEPSS